MLDMGKRGQWGSSERNGDEIGGFSDRGLEKASVCQSVKEGVSILSASRLIGNFILCLEATDNECMR